MYHQEKPIVVPACGSSMCPFSQFMEVLQPVLDVDFEFECNHDVLYQDGNFVQGLLPTSTTIIFAIFLIYVLL